MKSICHQSWTKGQINIYKRFNIKLLHFRWSQITNYPEILNRLSSTPKCRVKSTSVWMLPDRIVHRCSLFLLFYKGMPQTLKSELALLLKPQWCMQPTLTRFFVSSGRCGIPKWYVQLREPTAHGTHTPFTHFLLIMHRVKPPESRCFWLLCMLRLCSHSNIWKCPLASQSIFKMLLVLWNFWKHLCH